MAKKIEGKRVKWLSPLVGDIADHFSHTGEFWLLEHQLLIADNVRFIGKSDNDTKIIAWKVDCFGLEPGDTIIDD